MLSQAEKAHVLRDLHSGVGTFTTLSPSDLVTLDVISRIGAKALAVNASYVVRHNTDFDEEAMEHARAIIQATDLPINTDALLFDGDSPLDVALAISEALEIGLAGCSVGDRIICEGNRIHDFETASARVKAAVEEVRRVDFPFQITARVDGLRGENYDLPEAIRRAHAFAALGADVLMISHVPTVQVLQDFCLAMSKPVATIVDGALIATSFADIGASFNDLREMGVTRLGFPRCLNEFDRDGSIYPFEMISAENRN